VLVEQEWGEKKETGDSKRAQMVTIIAQSGHTVSIQCLSSMSVKEIKRQLFLMHQRNIAKIDHALQSFIVQKASLVATHRFVSRRQ